MRIVSLLCVMTLAACGGSAEAPPAAASDQSASPVAPVVSAKIALTSKSRLREDPIASQRAAQQWREHLEHEEHERQVEFDGQRLAAHRALMKLIAAQRARYDRAKTPAAVVKAREQIAMKVVELKKRAAELDPWSNSSRLLPHYEALATSLSGAYPDAKLAALAGDALALERVRADFDERSRTMTQWLAEVAEEREHEHEEQHEEQHEEHQEK